ncbi:heterodisulfide reductase-related iron-sulfur binding cluster [Aldersonia sp. NBC_00410]|uniref:heterodisulfide reductase-related iron-sulfur binding cluster n=1 Tax=Aldersonia sp. NBC_00410 TaxID=2975954 RepID=UPI00224DA78F|nr:heterodisulfide reductase-related iron-sulfur binding cluster [Aldersonia sp. NBC_00410]MCX5042033.1 heterodisulfide reductase-related iron-sulfur binding cluster [Aldersonia sp. NBC_00410]
MNALTITLGTIGALLSLLCWASFLDGAVRMGRTVAVGQPAPDRWRPFFPRFKQMIVEFIVHTRMAKFRTVGWAHWLVMIGFLAGAILWFEAYGQTFNPEFHWPIFGDWAVYHLMDEILGIGTVVGILTLIAIRQLNHPRLPERLSRFSGSKFGPAYFVEYVVLIEGLGMIFVKAGKIATYEHSNPWTDFFTMNLAKLLPASVVMVSIFAFIKLMSGMIWLLLVGRNITWGVAWHRFSAFPNIFFKREDDGGVALGALKPMMSKGRALDMENVDPDTDTLGAGAIEDFSWKGWLDFTTCTECGRCQSQCPAWNTGKPLSPKLLIMSLRDHGYAKAPYLLAGGRKDGGGEEIGLVDAEGNLREDKLNGISQAARTEAERPLVGDAEAGGIIDPEVLWSCTTCGACVEQCPVDIEHVDHIIDMRRYQVLIESEFPSELAGLFKNLENKGNPWGQNAKDRLNWINEMDFEIPVFGQDADSFADYEYLFWVGCAGAYEDRAKKTTKAVAELLATAGTKFLVLGADETCTGDSARRAGNEFLFQQLAMQNIELLDSVFEGVADSKRKIVVTCAHCFNALNNEYPQVGGNYEVVHHTQLLNRLVRAKKLVPVAPIGGQNVTYHDPCYLGRHNKVYDAPRELMAASGSTLTEMPRHGERSMCCGAGGARMWMEEQLGKRINVDRVDEALDTLSASSNGAGPGKIATGCPFCRVMLSDGATARQDNIEGDKVEVVDVAQLMLDSITRLDPAQLGENIKVIPRPRAEPAQAPSTQAEPVPQKSDIAAEDAAEAEEAERTEEVEAAASTPAAKAAPAGKGLAMKGLAKAPGAKAPGGAKQPAEAVDEAPAAEAPKPKGLAMKGLAKAPGPKAPGAKAPGKPAVPEPATDEAAPAAEAPKPKGLAMKGAAKAPGKGLQMKGAAKAPGAKAPAEAESGATAERPEAAEAAVPVQATESKPTVAAAESKPTVAAKGLAMKSGFKKPGAKASPPAAKPEAAAEQPAEASAPADAPAESKPTVAAAESKPTVAAAESKPTVAAAESKPTVAAAESKPTVAAKGLAMKSGFKKPGAKASAPAANPEAAAEQPAEASAPAEAPAESKPTDAAAESKPTVAAAESKPTVAAAESKPTVAAKGLAMKSGFKKPGAKASTPAAKPEAAAEQPAEASAPAEAPAESKPTVAAAEFKPTVAAAESKPTVAAKGLAMKSGFKKPGARPAAAAPAAPAAPEPTAPAEPEPAAPEPEATAEPEPQQPESSNGSDAPAPPAAKPGGLGFKSGAKAPGRRS